MNNNTLRVVGYVAFGAVVMSVRPATAQQGAHADPQLPGRQTVAFQQSTASADQPAQPPRAIAGATMSVADQTMLAMEAVHQFIAAVRTKDKSVFLASPLVSSHWQENQFSRQFEANFEDTMAADSGVASLDGRTPRIEEGNTRVDPEGRTHFLAFYSGRKQHLLQLSSVNENGAWRLVKFAL